MEKDRVMANQADWGLAVFDPVNINRYGRLVVSAGTLRNVIQFLLNKKVKLFYRISGKLESVNLGSIEDLKVVLEKYQMEQIPRGEAE